MCVNEDSVNSLSILQPVHLILHEEENLIKYAKKASAQNRAEALKIMRFLGLVASQGGLFHLPENMFLKKVLQKRLNTKIFISDKPEFCGAIGAGLFAVDSDRLLERLECNALNINPKNLVVLIGTNDIGIGVPTEYAIKSSIRA